MTIDFSILPPEINSTLMYAGPGAGPMIAAATAWQGIAAGLADNSMQASAMLAGLTSDWQGPSSIAMADKLSQHIAWLDQTAAVAQQTAAQAGTAVTAYETAFVGTVPPPVVAANRSLLMTLVATNFLGLNTPAIMATEAHYMEMWAQDAAAMFGYAGTSAQATTLNPFLPTTTPTTIPGVSVPVLPSGVTSILSAIGAPTTPWALLKDLSSFGNNSINGTNLASFINLGYTTNKDGAASAKAAAEKAGEALPAVVPVKPIPAQLRDLSIGLRGGGPVTASMGRSGTLGRISVPSSWTARTAELTSQVRALGTPDAVGAEPVAGAPGMGMPLASAAGSSRYAPQPRYGKTLTVMAGVKGV